MANEVQKIDPVDLERRKANIRHIDHTMSLALMQPLEVWDAEHIGQRTMEYLDKCKTDGVRVNLSSYALSLGTTPDGLNEMMCDKSRSQESRNAIQKGVAMVEAVMIEMMMEQRINPVTGIFLLKNHFGYKDQSEISFKGHIETDKKTLQAKYRAVVDED